MSDISDMTTSAIDAQVQGCEMGLKMMLKDIVKLNDADASDIMCALEGYIDWKIIQALRRHKCIVSAE